MIKFTDVCKAYIRYWYVIVICAVLTLTAVMFVVPHDEKYTASSSISIEKISAENETVLVSPSSAESITKEITVIANNTKFVNQLIDSIKVKNQDLADSLTVQEIKTVMSIDYAKNTTFFTIRYTTTDKDDSIMIVDTLAELIISDYLDRDNSTKLSKLSATDIMHEPRKMGVYVVIGILIGLVLGIVIVTFFVVFNPYVEDDDLLAKETNTDVLAAYKKKKELPNYRDLALNVELMLSDHNEKFVSLTTDATKYDISPIVNGIASIYASDKKVLIMSYNDVESKMDGIDYITIPSVTTDNDAISEMTRDYDIVLTICPNMTSTKHYLHMKNYLHDVLVVAKKWDSKVGNINIIKNNIEENGMNLLGVVYQR